MANDEQRDQGDNGGNGGGGPEGQPTRKMRALGSGRTGGRIRSALGKLRDGVVRSSDAVLIALGIALVGAVGFVGVKALTGGEETDSDSQPVVEIENVDSSWVPGQASLVTYSEFVDVAGRAADVGRERLAAHTELLAEIERQRKLAEKRARQRELRRLRRERREARREYKRALREAARERRRQERLIARKKRRIKRRIERMRERNKIEPGRECDLDFVREVFNCKEGYPF